MNKETIKKIQENADKITRCSEIMQDIVKKMMEMDKQKKPEDENPIMEALRQFYDEHQDEVTTVGEEVEKATKSKVPEPGDHLDAIDPSQLITQSRPHYDVALTNATGYLDGDTIYLALRYRVSTDVGDVDLLFPKVHLPITTYELPEVFINEHDQFKIRMHDQEFYLCDAPHPDYAGMAYAAVFEVMKDVPTREMTVSEIEEELGYKIKVIGGGCCGRCEE